MIKSYFTVTHWDDKDYEKFLELLKSKRNFIQGKLKVERIGERIEMSSHYGSDIFMCGVLCGAIEALKLGVNIFKSE